MSEVVKVSNLTKIFGLQEAVDDVNLVINEGEICGLIGKNGAGKTTLLKMISGVMYPSYGEIYLFGEDISSNYDVLKSNGTLIEEPGLFPNLTAYQNLKIKFLAIGDSDYSKINELLEFVELGQTGKKKVKHFSYGMKQRLGIALALVGEPKLLILDEPINGLDPQGIASIRNLILKVNKTKNTTVVISSHVLEEMTKIATNYVFIDEGKIIANMTKDELVSKCRTKLKLNVSDANKAYEILSGINIQNMNVTDGQNIEIFDKVDNINDITKALILADVSVNNISNESDSLEDFYFSIIGGGNND